MARCGYMWFYVPKSGFMSAVLDVRNSHFLITFLATSDRYGTYIFFGKFLRKWLPSVILVVRNSYFWPFQIDWPFWISYIHFRSQFWPISDRYRIVLFFFGANFGCPKISFDRISGHFWSIGHIGCPKFTFDGISGHFRSIRILIICLKFGQYGHFGCPKITFDKLFLNFFGQNGRRRPFWIGPQCQLSNSSEIFGCMCKVWRT